MIIAFCLQKCIFNVIFLHKLQDEILIVYYCYSNALVWDGHRWYIMQISVL